MMFTKIAVVLLAIACLCCCVTLSFIIKDIKNLYDIVNGILEILKEEHELNDIIHSQLNKLQNEIDILAKIGGKHISENNISGGEE